MTSAAQIKIAKPAAERDLFKRLQRLLQTIAPGSNRHEQLILMIEACIGEGIDTGLHLVDMLKRLGFNAQHVGMALADHNPHASRWKRSADGIYRLPE